MKVDFSRAMLQEDIKSYQEVVNKYHQSLVDKTCAGSDYTGWYNWPFDYDKEEFARIKEVAAEIREKADVLLVCGIGGSYLGARSAIEMLNGLYPDDKLEIIYTGNGLSPLYIQQVLNHIKERAFI